MIKLELNEVCKSFHKDNQSRDNTVKVLDNVSFSVREGEFVTLFGPNGCGKTTLLNVISDVFDCDSGWVKIDGKHPKEVKIGYIFQDYIESLFPWANAEHNIGLPLKLEGIPAQERHKTVVEFLRRLGIDIPLQSYPYQLSGGQKQLVAISRALIFQPDLFVMDEPFSALDYETRFSMQNKVQELWKEQGLTIVFVSHEIDEAIYLADRLILMTKRPMKVRKVFDIPLPRPRTHEMLETEEFFRLKSAVLHEFRTLMSL